MKDLPHQYQVHATADSEGEIKIDSPNLSRIYSAPPLEYGGPGDLWSPETLLVAAVADCFVLSFRAIAAGFKLPWISLSCEAEGVLDRIEKTTQFTQFHIQATLRISSEEDREKANKVLNKAEASCLITNSLKAASDLAITIEIQT